MLFGSFAMRATFGMRILKFFMTLFIYTCVCNYCTHTFAFFMAVTFIYTQLAQMLQLNFLIVSNGALIAIQFDIHSLEF